MDMMKTMLSAVVALGMAGANAASVDVEKCGRTSDGYAFLVDASGSMMQTIGQVRKAASEENGVDAAESNFDEMTRTELLKELMKKTAKKVSEKTEMASSVYSVAPFAALVHSEVRTAEEFAESLKALPSDLEVFGRPTWLGERAAAKFSEELSAPQAIVLATDGDFEFGEGRMGPVEALKNFYKANPNSCIHILSTAYTGKERAGIEALAAVNSCARVYSAHELMQSEEKFEDFIAEVYYRDCTEAAAVEISGVNFAFDKAEIGEASKAKLEAALEVLRSRDPSEKVVIVGWTDWTGSDAYNEKLSLRRAQAVKDYFAANGIDPERISVEGRGKSFKYSNKTGDGRWMNRRVELRFGDDLFSKDAVERISE